MAKRRPMRPTTHTPTGQDGVVGREVRDKGLLTRINQLLNPEGYVLVFLYGRADNPDQVGPYEVKIERRADAPHQDRTDRGQADGTQQG